MRIFHIFYNLFYHGTGAGGGYLLQKLQECDEKLGVEINPFAREDALNERKIHLVASCSELPDMWADVIISNHALEHVFCPWFGNFQIFMQLEKTTRMYRRKLRTELREELTQHKSRCELRKLRKKLKTGGKIAIVVPAAGKKDSFNIDNVHQHMYSWYCCNRIRA
jgi:hypothetical protein